MKEKQKKENSYRDKIKETEKRLDILEFFVIFFFAVCFTFIFAMIKIQGFWFNWFILFQYFTVFFGIAFLLIYIVLPIYRITKKVGTNCADLWSEFSNEWKIKTKLGKVKTSFNLFVGLSGVYSFYKIIEFFIKKI